MTNARGREITPEVRAMGELNYYGDCIAHSWSKHVGTWHDMKRKSSNEIKRVWRSRPFAQRLLARVVLMYKPVPIQREGTGEFVGWKRRFQGRYWRIDFAELAREFGCSARTLYDELALLRTLGLVTTQPVYVVRKEDGTKRSPLYVVPVVARIARITDAPKVVASEVSSPAASEETSADATEETSIEPLKKLQPSCTPSCTPKTLAPKEGERAMRSARANLDSAVSDEMRKQKPPAKVRRFNPRAHRPDECSRSAQVKLYRRRYPKVKLSRADSRLIADTFTDLDAWQSVLDVWRWRPRNWTAMQERYEDTIEIRDNPPPKAQAKQNAQPQQFGVGGELYRAAVAAGFDLSEIQTQQEANIGN